MSVSRTGTSRISSGSASTLRVGSVRPRAARRHFHQLQRLRLEPERRGERRRRFAALLPRLHQLGPLRPAAARHHDFLSLHTNARTAAGHLPSRRGPRNGYGGVVTIAAAGAEMAVALSTGGGDSGTSSGSPTSIPGSDGQGLADLAKLRADLGIKAGEGTVARLDVGGKSFYGVNAHGQSVAPLRVNAISTTHAEADAFAQAARAGAKGGAGKLFVDRALCPSCGTFGGVRSMARQLGLESLEVVTRQGTFFITP